VLGAILLCISFCFQVYAVEEQHLELEWCLDDYPGRHNYPEQSDPYGPTVDFMQELAKRSGIRIRYSANTPFARCLLLMAQGKTDLMVRLNTNAERERFMFMLPIQRSGEEVLLVLNDHSNIDSLNEFKLLHLLLIRGYTYPDIITQHPNIILVSSLEVGLQMLLKKRADAIMTSAENANIWFKKNPNYQAQFKPINLHFLELESGFIHLALSKASPHANIKPRLEKAIASMIEDNIQH